MNDIYYFGPMDNAKIGDYAEYRYTDKPMGFITDIRYSRILRKTLVKCSKYMYEIDCDDLRIYRVVNND